DMFDELRANVQFDTVKYLTRVRLVQENAQTVDADENNKRKSVEPEERQMFTNKDDTLAKTPKKRQSAKIGRNDPCPCGSGKKYKHCCGRNA
ncbi:MAG: SEC-C domain-containing protein, partial [Firmicutes bacterium]|nr:SEC-C domain-containing protein [Bacillota bacterium]